MEKIKEYELEIIRMYNKATQSFNNLQEKIDALTHEIYEEMEEDNKNGNYYIISEKKTRLNAAITNLQKVYAKKDYMYLLMRNLGICQKYQMDYKTGLYKIDKE